MIDHLTMSGQERAELGCVLSFENSEGKTLVLHRTGPLVQGCADMCDLAESLDPSFRVTAYSSPATIYTNITGGRMRLRGLAQPRVRPGDAPPRERRAEPRRAPPHVPARGSP